MDQFPVQWGVAILPGIPHAMETGISTGRLGPWFICAFTIFFLLFYLFFFIIFAFQTMTSYPSGQVLWSNKLC